MDGHDLLKILLEEMSLSDFLRMRMRLLAEEGCVSIPCRRHYLPDGISSDFHVNCELGLEGIVAKYKHAPHSPVETTWFKIRNRNYSQWVGREELFET